MKYTTKVTTKKFDFTITIESDDIETHSHVDDYPEVTNIIFQESIDVLRRKLVTLEPVMGDRK